MIPSPGAFVPPVFSAGAPVSGAGPGGLGGAGDFNGVMDALETPDPSGPEFPAIIPPASSLGQAGTHNAIGPMLGPGAPGPVGTAGQLFKPLGDWLGEVNTQLNHASQLGSDFAAGDNVDIHDVMLATEEADIGMSLTTQIRNKLLEAYQQVMQMPV